MTVYGGELGGGRELGGRVMLRALSTRGPISSVPETSQALVSESHSVPSAHPVSAFLVGGIREVSGRQTHLCSHPLGL